MWENLWARHQKWLRVLPWIFLLWVLAEGFVGDLGILRLHELREERRRLESEIRHQEQISLELRSEVRALKGDPRYLERLAREELGLVRPGEVIYQFSDETSSGSRDASLREPSSAARAPQSPLEKPAPPISTSVTTSKAAPTLVQPGGASPDAIPAPLD